MALVYESMKDYGQAWELIQEVISVCGHDPEYERAMKRIAGKVK